MTDKEILDKYIDLDSSCLTRCKKKNMRRLIYKYKDVFSLRDEIGTCPNIEVEIEVTDRSPFFIRPFTYQGRGQGHIGQGNEKIVLFRYSEGRVFSQF